MNKKNITSIAEMEREEFLQYVNTVGVQNMGYKLYIHYTYQIPKINLYTKLKNPSYKKKTHVPTA